MAISTSLSGRLRNTSLPKTHALFPLHEAVVNSIQSIDASGKDLEQSRISVRIHRSPQAALFSEAAEDASPQVPSPIIGFEIQDNGEGFHDANFSSFQTLDSDYKVRYGCRGVGRLLWLKAFDKVEISSNFIDADGALKNRSFIFAEPDGVSADLVVDAHGDPGTNVQLLNFAESYRKAAPKATKSIARGILEHCLWYFVRPGGAPNISVADDTEKYDLNELFDDYALSDSESSQLEVKGQDFEVVHLRLRVVARSNPTLSWCAASRVVHDENLIGKVPGLYGKLTSDGKSFTYASFVSSPYLDERVRSERTGFDIPESSDGTLDETEPAMVDIREAVIDSIEKYLGDSLTDARAAGRERVRTFVEQKGPRYRPLLRHLDEATISVDPQINDRDLELLLHKQLTDFETELMVEGQEVLRSDALQSSDYEERVDQYLAKVEDIKKSDLAAYVSRRWVILELLERALKINPDGRYSREDEIHRLIMPMRSTSDDASADAANLWVIDERLAFHNFLASDKTIKSMPITSSDSAKEPDLLGLKLVDIPTLVANGDRLPLASITVVEIKRPMRNDAGEGEGKDPITQALGYLRRVREGSVTTAEGRLIPGGDQIPGFVYILADLTPSMKERCDVANLRPTQDGSGYFGYNERYKAYIEVIGFDGLLNAAKQRNRAFFDKLGLPIN
ncbi:hypothetical protein ACQP04_05905 [Pseudonocardia halophobica]|uniref:hypothetical protein n=1 Tax=Pseudonocardia halophobica TaxID=29401 RepID=UPI003D8D93C9